MTNWTNSIQTQTSRREIEQTAQYERMRIRWLKRKYNTHSLEYTYSAVADVVFALYTQPQSVVTSVNIACALQDIEVAQKRAETNTYFEYMLSVYEEALSELKNFNKVNKT